MSNKQVQQLVQNIGEKKYTDASRIVKRELSERILAGIHSRKRDLSTSMLKSKTTTNEGKDE